MSSKPIQSVIQLVIAAGIGLVTYVAMAKVDQPHVNAFAFFILLSALLYFAIPYLAQDDVGFLRKIVVASLALRLGLVAAQRYVWPWLYVYLRADALAYDAQAWRMARSWQMELSHFQWPQSFAEIHMWTQVHRSAILYSLFGHSVFAVEATNIVWSTSAAVAVYVIAFHLFDRRAARTGAVLAAFLPSLMLWSTHNLKDPVTTGAIAWSICGFVMLRSRQRAVIASPIIVISWLLGFMFRPYVGILMMAGQVGALGIVAFRSNTLLARGTRVALILALGAASLTLGNRALKELYGQQATLAYAEEKRESFYEMGVRAGKLRGSEYIFDIRATTPAQMILQLPIRVPLFFLEPFPIRRGTLRLMATYPEQVFLYATIPLFILGISRGWRQDRSGSLFCLLSVTVVIIPYALGTSIAGEAVRMRAQVLPVLFAFTGAGWSLYWARRFEHAAVRIRFRPAVRERGTT